MKNEKEPILSNAKFGQLEFAYASFDEQSDGIRIAGATAKPDLHVSFALTCEEALKLADNIRERAKARLGIMKVRGS